MWTRAGLSLAALCAGATAVAMVTGEAAYGLPTVASTPAAAIGCSTVGSYRAPDPGSAGLPRGLVLCPSGPITVTEPGAVLDGWDVRGGIVVDAPGVVVRRSRVTGDGVAAYGVRTTPTGSVRIEDTTLTGDFPEAAVGDERWTAERIEITRVTRDGARLGDGARLRNSVLHDFAPAPGAAPDALVLRGTDVVVEGNRIEPGSGAASAVRVAAGQEGPVVIRGNVLGGGHFTVHEDADAPADVRITDNRFRRDAVRGPIRVSPSAVLRGNTFDDGHVLPVG